MKDPVLNSLIGRVMGSFAPGALEVRDHWEFDLVAIGFGRPGDEARLVYVRVRPDDPERCAVVCETGDAADTQHDVTVGERMTFNELLRAIADHLDLPLSP